MSNQQQIPKLFFRPQATLHTYFNSFGGINCTLMEKLKIHEEKL